MQESYFPYLRNKNPIEQLQKIDIIILFSKECKSPHLRLLLPVIWVGPNAKRIMDS